jgi:Zn-dependent protease
MPGCVRLFRLFGIDVYLHWAWAIVAIYSIQTRRNAYTSIIWNVAEYICLFLIVLMHEFGHALACRSVGGKADRIKLWPLGGVAYVSPPQRPGAVLWSIVAGPLVNVLLIPVTLLIVIVTRTDILKPSNDVHRFISTIFLINGSLLIFNMMPIYPLDGGQIVRSLLWFIFGRARSLMISCILGIVTIVALGLWIMSWGVVDVWYMVIAAFAVMLCLKGLQEAKFLLALARLPRHQHLRCPGCAASPPMADLFTCSCGMNFDAYATAGQCPACGSRAPSIPCIHCGETYPSQLWGNPIVQTPVFFPPPTTTPYWRP